MMQTYLKEAYCVNTAGVHALGAQAGMQEVLHMPTFFIVLQDVGNEPVMLLLLTLTLYICSTCIWLWLYLLVIQIASIQIPANKAAIQPHVGCVLDRLTGLLGNEWLQLLI